MKLLKIYRYYYRKNIKIWADYQNIMNVHKVSTESLSTPCQTPDMIYDINISDAEMETTSNNT
jgi:hypothetical protein